jgi:uncharacterized protein
MDYEYIIKAKKALRRAIQHSEVDELRKLILDGLDINTILDDDNTLLIQSVVAEDLKLVKELVKLGADVNIQPPGGNTAIWYAASFGLEEIFNFLAPLTSPDLYQEAEEELQIGIVAKKRRDNVELDILSNSVISRDIQSILEILQKGFDINTIDEHGKTLLFIPCFWGHHEIVEVLIDNGADINFFAENGSDTPLISVISGLGAVKYHAFLSDKTKHQHISVMKILLNAGVNVNAKTTEGQTALITAVNSQSAEAVKLLMNYDADINVKDNRGNTILKFARERGDAEIIQILIDAGAIDEE